MSSCMELTQPDNVLRNLQGGSLVPWRPNRGELHEKHHSLATWRSDRRNYSPQCDGNAWTLNVTWHLGPRDGSRLAYSVERGRFCSSLAAGKPGRDEYEREPGHDHSSARPADSCPCSTRRVRWYIDSSRGARQQPSE